MIFQGMGTSIAKKPYIFVIFQEGGPNITTDDKIRQLLLWFAL